jgi:hypothetical protein
VYVDIDLREEEKEEKRYAYDTPCRIHVLIFENFERGLGYCEERVEKKRKGAQAPPMEEGLAN